MAIQVKSVVNPITAGDCYLADGIISYMNNEIGILDCSGGYKEKERAYMDY
jgi:hypothetical protein